MSITQITAADLSTEKYMY